MTEVGISNDSRRYGSRRPQSSAVTMEFTRSSGGQLASSVTSKVSSSIGSSCLIRKRHWSRAALAVAAVCTRAAFFAAFFCSRLSSRSSRSSRSRCMRSSRSAESSEDEEEEERLRLRLRLRPIYGAGGKSMRAQREEEKKNGSRIGEIAARSHEIERDS